MAVTHEREVVKQTLKAENSHRDGLGTEEFDLQVHTKEPISTLELELALQMLLCLAGKPEWKRVQAELREKSESKYDDVEPKKLACILLSLVMVYTEDAASELVFRLLKWARNMDIKDMLCDLPDKWTAIMQPLGWSIRQHPSVMELLHLTGILQHEDINFLDILDCAIVGVYLHWDEDLSISEGMAVPRTSLYPVSLLCFTPHASGTTGCVTQ